MASDYLRYDRMVESALRGVVRESLNQCLNRGLTGSHHFYISFRTNHPGVDIPDYLRAQYPGDMTIVLQYQFFGLEIEDDWFAVTLSFNNSHERLTVPFAAITTFADPSVNFALQFQASATAENTDSSIPTLPLASSHTHTHTPSKEPGASSGDEEPKRGEVVTLDAFRKK